ncbi:MAG TPA: nitroreductase family protein [Myxococcales bacterium]|jgi:ferredoxin
MPDSPWRLDSSKCTECSACERSCNHGVITCSGDGAKGLPRQRDDRYCNSCGHCVAVCPTDAITVKGIRAVEKGALPTPEMLENLFAFRRSTREFLPDAIPEAVMDKLLHAARLAPSGCNNRRLGYQVLSGQAEVIALGRSLDRMARPFARVLGNSMAQRTLGLVNRGFVRNLTNQNMIGGMNSLLDKTEGWKDGDKGDWIALDAPALIIIHGDPGASTPKDDAVIAATFITLYAETLGLGTCFNGVLTGFLNDFPGALRKVGIAKPRKVYSVLSVGYPDTKRVAFKKGLVRD